MTDQTPIFDQFFLMQLCPSKDQVILLSRHHTSKYCRRINRVTGYIFTIRSVKVRQLMPASLKKDSDNNSVKTRYFRHNNLKLANLKVIKYELIIAQI